MVDNFEDINFHGKDVINTEHNYKFILNFLKDNIRVFFIVSTKHNASSKYFHFHKV